MPRGWDLSNRFQYNAASVQNRNELYKSVRRGHVNIENVENVGRLGTSSDHAGSLYNTRQPGRGLVARVRTSGPRASSPSGPCVLVDVDFTRTYMYVEWSGVTVWPCGN